MTVKEKQNQTMTNFDNLLKETFGTRYSGMEDGDGGRMYFEIDDPAFGKHNFEYHRSHMSIVVDGSKNDSDYSNGKLLEKHFQQMIDFMRKLIFAS